MHHIAVTTVLRSWRWAKDCPKLVELIQRSIKFLLLHLVGYLYYSPQLMMHGQTQFNVFWLVTPWSVFYLVVVTECAGECLGLSYVAWSISYLYLLPSFYLLVCFKTTEVSPYCFVVMEGTLFMIVVNVVFDVLLLYLISMERAW